MVFPEIDPHVWDWFWSWSPDQMTFVALEQLLAKNDMCFSGSPRDITEDYVDCHRVLMEIANATSAAESGFTSSARVRANRWRPMLVSELKYEKFCFPIVTCLGFMNINLLDIASVDRAKIVGALTAALEMEPKWGWGQGHRIWWCIDGANPERLEHYRNI